jgi:hypothetical protein
VTGFVVGISIGFTALLCAIFFFLYRYYRDKKVADDFARWNEESNEVALTPDEEAAVRHPSFEALSDENPMRNSPAHSRPVSVTRPRNSSSPQRPLCSDDNAQNELDYGDAYNNEEEARAPSPTRQKRSQTESQLNVNHISSAFRRQNPLARKPSNPEPYQEPPPRLSLPDHMASDNPMHKASLSRLPRPHSKSRYDADGEEASFTFDRSSPELANIRSHSPLKDEQASRSRSGSLSVADIVAHEQEGRIKKLRRHSRSVQFQEE